MYTIGDQSMALRFIIDRVWELYVLEVELHLRIDQKAFGYQIQLQGAKEKQSI